MNQEVHMKDQPDSPYDQPEQRPTDADGNVVFTFEVKVAVTCDADIGPVVHIDPDEVAEAVAAEWNRKHVASVTVQDQLSKEYGNATPQ